ncbi:MAG: LysR family transcriptional regulator [Clostridia bacterium]|nr:LysR family transcriptional regulator [Clostridia bacterium]
MYNRQIQTFIQVADSGSFTSAAEKLFITSASVMKQINGLENLIGVKLLERTNHGVSLTPAGCSIYKDAKKSLRRAMKQWSGRGRLPEPGSP